MKEGEFFYEGVTITVDERARFVARHQGQHLVTPSLASMKKKIDQLGIKFEPFDGWIVRNSDPTEVKIVGVKPNARRGANHRGEWVTDNGLRLDTIVRDTPENRKLVEELIELVEKNEKLRTAMDGAEHDLIYKILDFQERP